MNFSGVLIAIGGFGIACAIAVFILLGYGFRGILSALLHAVLSIIALVAILLLRDFRVPH